MKIKKIVVVIVLIIFALNYINIALADDIDPDTDTGDIHEETLEAISKSSNEPQIESRAALIFDRDSRQVLWGKQENLRVPMASTTNAVTS